MPITARCPGCNKTLKVKDELAGKKVKCPGCASVLTIPNGGAAPAPQPAPARPQPAVKAPVPKPRPPVLDEDEELEEPQQAMKRSSEKPAPRPAPKAPAAPKPRPPILDEDEELEEPHEAMERGRQKPAAKAPAPRAASRERSPLIDEDEELEDTGREEAEEPVLTPAAPGSLDKQTQILWFVGLGLLVLLAVSVFLPWVSIMGMSIAGIRATAGIIMLVFALGAAGVNGTMFALKKPLPPALPGGAMAGTYATVLYLIFMIRVGSFAGIGVWIGLIAGLGSAGTFAFASIRCPHPVAPFNKPTSPPFLRNFGGLLCAVALGLVLGIVFSFIGGSSAGGSSPPPSFHR